MNLKTKTKKKKLKLKKSTMKTKKVRIAIRAVLKDDVLTDKILELAKHQHDY